MEKTLRQRTCIGCRTLKDKRKMLRVFKSNNGEVRIDLKGNMPGRGAYLCSLDCMELALKKSLIGRSLRVKFKNEFEESEKKAIASFFSKIDTNSCEE